MDNKDALWSELAQVLKLRRNLESSLRGLQHEFNQLYQSLGLKTTEQVANKIAELKGREAELWGLLGH